ncbi:MAG: hypothetical protein JO128_12415 [Alphaproteobacteria bacterium]|nr:hypothetical protein [Alphaproteobacteria bacterium]
MKMPSYSCVLSLVAVAGLLACSAPNTVWVKAGAGPDELRAAQRDCAAESEHYGFVDTQLQSDGGIERERGSSATGDMYRRCMEGEGWKRQRTDQGPPK